MEPTPLRKCRSCDAVALNFEDLDNFIKGGDGKYGRRNLCRACGYRANREWRDRNKDRVLARGREYYWENRDSLLDYHARYRKANAERRREYSREYGRSNPDKVNANSRTRKARKRGLPSERYTRTWLYNRDEGRCVYCTRETGMAEGHIDHVIPLAYTGDDNPGDVRHNVVWSCPECNLSKNDRVLAASWLLVKALKISSDQYNNETE